MKQKRIGLLASLGTVCVILVVFLVYKHVNSTSSSAISATITQVVSRPNRAEDGYYGFIVKDKAGKEYQINATGFLNTAPGGSEPSITCITVPPLESGDIIVFMLPGGAPPDPQNPGSTVSFTTCYDKGQSVNYFIHKQ